MNPLRIHLGQMPHLLRAIINDLISKEPDLIVVGSSGLGDDPLRRAAEQQADMVITKQGIDSGSACLDVIVAQSPLSIFAISADGTDATAITMVRSSIALDTVERGNLADAIRRVAICTPEVDGAVLR